MQSAQKDVEKYDNVFVPNMKPKVFTSNRTHTALDTILEDDSTNTLDSNINETSRQGKYIHLFIYISICHSTASFQIVYKLYICTYYLYR